METIVGLLSLALLTYWAVRIIIGSVRLATEAARRPARRRAEQARAAAARAEQSVARAERRSRYLSELEPKWRSAPGYPPDWEIRRALVFMREERKCEECSAECKETGCFVSVLWSEDPETIHTPVKYVSGGHVHHKIPISRGGDHSLDNLSLLCERCHSDQHPSNRLLDEAAQRKESPHRDSASRIRRELKRIRAYSSDAVKLVRARTDWSCRICSSSIKPGQSYLRGRTPRERADLQVCSSCQKLFRIDR